MEDRERQGIELDLRSADEEIRRLAVERLGSLPQEEALPRLLECLGDPGWRVRKAAVERLAEAPEAWPVAEGLVAALSDGENPGRRNAAVEALTRRGASTVDALLGATRSDDVDVRKLAVDTLAGIGAPRALGRLREMLDDPDPNARAAAADALGVIGDEQVAPALLEVATRGGDDPLVAFSALQALARLEASVDAAALEPLLDQPLLRPAVFAVLGCAPEGDAAAEDALLKGLAGSSRSAREAAVASLLRLLANRDGPAAEVLVERIRAAGASSPELVDDALERLEHADLPTRLVLVQFLGVLRVRRAAVPVLRASTDEALTEVGLAALESLGERAEEAFDEAWSALEADARRLACHALARTGGAAGQARLLAGLDDAEASVRSAAAAGLGARRCAAALPDLVRRLEAVAGRGDDLDGEDELAALTRALVVLTEPAEGAEDLHDRAVELLAGRLEGAPEPVRLALASVLGRIGRPRDASLVTWLLKDPADGVRRAAVQALARLEDAEASEPLRLALADESPAVRIAAARALATAASPRALDDLERLADDDDPRVRAAALRAVGERVSERPEAGVERALERLESALQDEGAVALAAVEALQAVGGAGAARAARGLLRRDEPELVQAAVVCIGAHGGRDDLEEMVPLVGHAHWAVRAEVIQTLAERSVVAAVPAVLRRLEMEQDDFVRDAILRALRRLEG